MSATGLENRVPLAEICRIDAPIVDPREPEYRDLPHVSGEDIESGTGKLLTLHSASEDGMISGKYLFDSGVVLYSKLRPYLRKVAVADFRGLRSADMYPLVFDRSRVCPDYAKYCLLSDDFSTHAVEASARARMPKLNREQLLAYDFPLPPLAEQERIAAELTAALSAVDAARRAARDRVAAAEALPAAYLREVFEGPDASGWEVCRLADLVRTPIRTGISKPGNADSDKRCLTLSAVRGRVLDLEACKPAEVSDYEAQGNWVRPGCFYVVRGNGNRELVGRGAFAPEQLSQPVLFPDLLFQLDLSERIDAFFFWCLWSSRPVRYEIEERARTAAGIYKINTGNLNALPLRLPSPTDQRRIAADLSARLAAAEALIARCREELAAIDALPAALLRQAFGGDIPASAAS